MNNGPWNDTLMMNLYNFLGEVIKSVALSETTEWPDVIRYNNRLFVYDDRVENYTESEVMDIKD
jgi:hypothetical protein